MQTAKHYHHIVVLTGAGISAESGFRTFRDHNGLWEGQRVEDVATPEAFACMPDRVHRFYNARRAQLRAGAEPNFAHRALAQFEQHYPGNFLLITQNVDNLHEQAGSKALLHMHGELTQVCCTQCESTFYWEHDLDTDTECPSCQNAGSLRPDIVWFGEIPKYMDEIQKAVLCCDLFVAIGTSGVVYPAAGFVQMAKMAGAHTVELNLEPSGNPMFDISHKGKASELVPHFFALD